MLATSRTDEIAVVGFWSTHVRHQLESTDDS